MPGPIERVILVYDGDSGVRALLLDVVKKAIGREDCPLCEITYGPLGKRRAWSACASRLGVAVEELHRDQLPAAWEIARDDLPCILARAGDEAPSVLLTREAIVSCRSSVEQLDRELRAALAAAQESRRSG
jgi:hypothetical protein